MIATERRSRVQVTRFNDLCDLCDFNDFNDLCDFNDFNDTKVTLPCRTSKSHVAAKFK